MIGFRFIMIGCASEFSAQPRSILVPCDDRGLVSGVKNFRLNLFLGLFAAALLLCACRRTPPPPPVSIATRPAVVEDLNFLTAKVVGEPFTGQPWISHVARVDLDGDGLMDVVFCEARENKVLWLRQVSPGEFVESVLAEDIPAPVHVSAAVMTASGRPDLLVASMGEIFPNNDRIGSVIILENLGGGRFNERVIASHIARVTDVQAADFNGDGRLDLAVGQFGYDQGEIQWMENLGDWQFRSHELLSLSGLINLCIADFNGDGHPDIAAIFSQQWEEIHLFTNHGRGGFTGTTLWGSTNEDYACSGMTLCDLNRDGLPDLLFSNGDGFGPASRPGPRPWHGVQWLENRGGGMFKFHRIGDLAGAFSPIAVDLDGDGQMDVVALSAFNEWEKPEAVSMVWFHNDGKMNFTPTILAHTPTHLLTLTELDRDRQGRPELVTGAFHAYPPYGHMSRLLLWRRPPAP